MKTYLIEVDTEGKEQSRHEVNKALVAKGTTLVVSPVGGYWDESTARLVLDQLKTAGVQAVVIAGAVELRTEEKPE